MKINVCSALLFITNHLVNLKSLTPFTRRVSHKHSLPKTLAVHRVLYPSMLTESWVERKRCTSNRENRSLWGSSSKISSRVWVNFTRNGLKARSHQTRMKRYAWMIYMLSQCKDAIENPAALFEWMRRRELSVWR